MFNCQNTKDTFVYFPARIPLNTHTLRKSPITDENNKPLEEYNISCPGGSDGQIIFYIGTGQGSNNPPFTFWVTNELEDTIETGTINRGIGNHRWINNLHKGTYNISVTDTVGCHTVNSEVLAEPDPIKVHMHSPVYIDTYNISCLGFKDGSIVVDSVTGGNSWYHYRWTTTVEGVNLVSGNIDQDSLKAGIYNLQITDTLGCIANDSITLIEPEGIELVDTVFSKSADGLFNISCYGADDGSIDLHLEGGSGSYSYYWTTSDGLGLKPAEKDQNGLTAGTYHVAVSDESSCYREWDFTLSQPDPLHIEDSVSLANDGSHNVSCAGGNDGLINLTVSGGSIGNYSYSWTTDNGRNLDPGAEDESGLSAGDYHVVVTDLNGCMADTTITLTQPDSLHIQLMPTHISCDPGYNDGAIQIQVNGGTGTGTYDYLWSNGQTTSELSGLTAGWYKLQVTDQNGCMAWDSVEILLPPPLEIGVKTSDFNGNNISCNGLHNGSIEINIVSGTPEYQYSWIGPDGFESTDSSLYQLGAGNYSLHVVDTKHCMGDTTVRITEPDPLVINVTTSKTIAGDYNINCFGDHTGTIDLGIKGGTPEYTYFWNNGYTTPHLEDLPAGNYQVKVTDMNGCTEDTVISLSQPDSFMLTIQIKNTYCPDMSDGEAVAVLLGGVTPYTYRWSTGETDDRLLNITPGEYSIFVSDANMCAIVDTFTVKSDRPQCLEIPTAFSPNGDEVNDTWEIGEIGLYPDAVVEIYNRWGELIFRSNRGYGNRWDGTHNGKPLPMDSYYYVIDLHNGTKPVTGNVTIVR